MPSNAPEILLLLRREVFPGLHAAQHLLLPVGRQAVKTLQTVLKFLLAFTRKATKRGIVFKRPPLLVVGHLTVLIQPLPGVVTLRRRLVGPVFALRGSLRLELRRGSHLRSRRRTIYLRTRFVPFLPRLFPPGLEIRARR